MKILAIAALTLALLTAPAPPPPPAITLTPTLTAASSKTMAPPRLAPGVLVTPLAPSKVAIFIPALFR